MSHKLAVKGIIRRADGKILIVKRSAKDDHLPGIWETVGGAVEAGETPQVELKREVMEEVGLEIEIGEPFNVFSFTKDNGEHKIGITFICDHVSGQVKLSDEHSDFRWINPADFKQYESNESLYNEITSYANKFSGEHERFVVSQKGIIIHDNKCLVVEVNKRPNVWDLPGGRIDNNENSQESFSRELKEELAVEKFEVVEMVDYEAWHTKSGFAVCGIVNLIRVEEEIKLSNEHTGLKWISEEEAEVLEFVWPIMGRMIKNGFRRAKVTGDK